MRGPTWVTSLKTLCYFVLGWNSAQQRRVLWILRPATQGIAIAHVEMKRKHTVFSNIFCSWGTWGAGRIGVRGSRVELQQFLKQSLRCGETLMKIDTLIYNFYTIGNYKSIKQTTRSISLPFKNVKYNYWIWNDMGHRLISRIVIGEFNLLIIELYNRKHILALADFGQHQPAFHPAQICISKIQKAQWYR